MKTMLKLLAILCTLCVLAGCRQHATDMLATEAPAVLDKAGSTEGKQDYTLYFPDDAPYSYQTSLEPEETVYIREIIKTNTTRITVKNQGETAIVCNLYYPDDTSYEIQTYTLQPGKSEDFSGLSSSYLYCIGIRSAEGGDVKVSVSG